jgi:transcriptional regulator HMO1
VSLSNVQKGLAHVQNGLNDLMTAYIKHTASVLAGEDGTLEGLELPSDVADTANSAMAAATFAINNAVAHANATPANAPDAGKGKKRKREKKEKDPNAPKRPLTAAFLFIQAARPVVKRDLEAELKPGEKLEPNAVNMEVNKRWNEMPETEKEVGHAANSSVTILS